MALSVTLLIVNLQLLIRGQLISYGVRAELEPRMECSNHVSKLIIINNEN